MSFQDVSSVGSINTCHFVEVAVDVPRPGFFTYQWLATEPPLPGARVIVPWGKARRVGVVWRTSDRLPSALDQSKIKPVICVLSEFGVLPKEWRSLIEFAATYYHYPIGPAVHDALPKLLKTLGSKGLGLVTVRRLAEKLASTASTPMAPPAAARTCSDTTLPPPSRAITERALSQDQQSVIDAVDLTAGYAPHLLFGITGSGKTEVYLHLVRTVAAKGKQSLVLIPEINLTPQAESVFRERLAGLCVVVLHSGLADKPRLESWLQAMLGRADVVIATRLGIFTPMPALGLIVVDEEHDLSYKQMEGLKYSARDLAIARAQHNNCPVLLGSATPSLESWYRAEQRTYKLHTMARRAVENATLPTIELINMANHSANDGLSAPAGEALQTVFSAGQQSIVFLNRRGYAPVLACRACAWVAGCTHCSSHVVWHRMDRQLRCHHCGAVQAVPKQCPACGNQDLAPFGRGTQRVEETLQQVLPNARLLRIDADTTRNKGQAEAAFEAAHAGQADILIGTQMIAKGHDFKNVKLVVALNVDAALFSSQARAPERLFAQLMQVAGRAGRHGTPGKMLIQTRYPEHPLFKALQSHDYVKFAQTELALREQAHMPPFAFLALLRADHRTIKTALEFLQWAKEQALPYLESNGVVWVCDPVPLNIVKVAGVERAQLLIESTSRPKLHQFLTQWLQVLWVAKGSVRWYLEIDPQEF